MSASGNQAPDLRVATPLPPALRSRNPLAWFTLFGPGAVIASLTIGSGELIFSSRGGALFGYRLLWFFLLVLAFKWILVYTTGRHMILTGAHPFQRWMELPGPRGWFPLVFLLLAIGCFPIWVSFHAGTIGTLLSWLAGTESALRGAAHFVWGIGILALVLVLVAAGGYSTLERIQLVIIILMLLCVVVSLVLLHPPWLELVKGLVIPRPLEYPAWVALDREIASRPVWVETITYVGVIGGSGYDYLAYVSYLRAKGWGRAGGSLANPTELETMAADASDLNRRWLRALLIDSILSFLSVLVFSGVFVACGAMILGPQHQVPSGENLLNLQAEFVTPAYPWLKPVYFVGAFLTIFGTLYGTIEVAPAVLRELIGAVDPGLAEREAPRLRFWSVAWVSLGGLGVLVWSFFHAYFRGGGSPPGLIPILTPANLFTGVLACGLICLLSIWVDRRWLPGGLRMHSPLALMNLVAGIIFLMLGLKGYWDHSRWIAFAILGGTLAVGWIAAPLATSFFEHRKGIRS